MSEEELKTMDKNELLGVIKAQRFEIERLKEQLNDEIQEELKQSKIMVKKQQEIERLNNIIVKLKKVLWQRCEEARKNEQYVRLNCYKDILNELVNTIYEVDGETNE